LPLFKEAAVKMTGGKKEIERKEPVKRGDGGALISILLGNSGESG